MNTVQIEGRLTRKPVTGKGQKGSYAFFTIQPNGDRTYISCVAYGVAADTVGNMAEGDAVKLTGKVGSGKDKKLTEALKKDTWILNVTIDTERGGSIESDIPF